MFSVSQATCEHLRSQIFKEGIQMLTCLKYITHFLLLPRKVGKFKKTNSLDLLSVKMYSSLMLGLLNSFYCIWTEILYFISISLPTFKFKLLIRDNRRAFVTDVDIYGDKQLLKCK